ncbi:hypothetical protein [Mycoplasmopsis pulmonis]|uniref:hypothetical protein n=1 Tax=Mycoplasmopsis pulmonis TaxID=2107 RepID=UPI001005021E|nr:hypothetical protein [Mycoplasmopsis pulmonis]VEU68551.1 Uncharacterised protein [Mycoplasmopsis pulmonis]
MDKKLENILEDENKKALTIVTQLVRAFFISSSKIFSNFYPLFFPSFWTFGFLAFPKALAFSKALCHLLLKVSK